LRGEPNRRVHRAIAAINVSALDRAGIAGLTEGQRVAVDVIDGRKGPEAAGLRLI
jgi:cold shock CspA family protein